MNSFLLPAAILTIAIIFAAMSVSIAVRRVVRQRQLARLEARTSRLRPLMLRLLSEDEPNLSSLDELKRGDGKMAETLAWSLLPKVRGSSRAELSKWLQDRGAVDRAQRRTYRAGAVGRSRAAEHLGASGSSAVAKDVIRLLGDRKQEVRIVAARALGKLGDPTAVPNLLDSMEGKKAVPMSLVSMALIHIGPAAIDELVKGLGRQSPRARAVCAELLGIHGAFQAAKWLLLLVEHDAVDEVRVRAASALGRLGAPNGVRALVRAMAPSQSTALRTAAAHALGQIGGPEAIDALQNAVNDPSPGVSVAAAEALAGLGDRGADILRLVASGEGDTALRAQDWLARKELSDRRTRHRTRAIGRTGARR